MAQNHSQAYVFSVNESASALAVASAIGVRQEQINLLVVLGDRCAGALDHSQREQLHALTLELGLQQRLLKASVKKE